MQIYFRNPITYFKETGAIQITLPFLNTAASVLTENSLCTLSCNHQNNLHYEVHYYQRVQKLWKS